MANRKKPVTALVIELDTGTPVAPVGHNSGRTLDEIIASINALTALAIDFKSHAVAIGREACVFTIRDGNSAPLAALNVALLYLGKGGMVTKLQQYVLQSIHFQHFKGPDGKPNYRKAKKGEAAAIHDPACLELGFMEWSKEAAPKQEWELDKSIRSVLNHLVKDGYTAAEARELVVAASRVVALKVTDTGTAGVTLTQADTVARQPVAPIDITAATAEAA